MVDARHPRLRRPRDRPNLTRIPWTRSALIQDCHETQTRLPYGEAPTADYGGAMEMCRDSRGSVRTRTETRTRLAFGEAPQPIMAGPCEII